MFEWYDDQMCPRGAEFANYMILRCKTLEGELKELRRQIDSEAVRVGPPSTPPTYMVILVVVVAVVIGLKVISM